MSKEILVTEGGTEKVIALMIESAGASTDYPYVRYFAEKIDKLPTLQDKLEALYTFTYSIYDFVPDAGHHQTIRTAKALLDDGIGNCVDASVFISSVLIYLGIPHEFNFFAQDKTSGYNHVFVVAENNYILDTILGKKGSGTESWFDEKQDGYFNAEIPEFFDRMKVKII